MVRGWGGRTYEAACRRAITNIKASIDRGVAVVLWGVDSAEFGVVYGYDDADGVLLVSGVFGQGPEGSVPILYENVGRTFGGAPLLHYQVPIERVPLDLDQACRESLAEYVNRMERPMHFDPSYHYGLAAYDAWIKALSHPDLNQRGLRYLVYVYYETKDFTAAYMRRLAETWHGMDGMSEIAESFSGGEPPPANLCSQPDPGPEEPGRVRTDPSGMQFRTLIGGQPNWSVLARV